MTGEELKSLPSDFTAASALYAEYALACEPIRNNIDRSRNPIYVPLNPKSFLSQLRGDLPFFTVMCEGSDEPVPGIRRVDVALSTLKAFTNAAPGVDESDVTFSRCLVDAAIAGGSASMFIIHDEWFSKADPALSEYRGVILIDSEKFLEHIDQGTFAMMEDGQTETSFRVDYSLGPLNNLVMGVDIEPFSNKADTAPLPTCPDFAIVDPAIRFERGYNVSLKDQGDDGVILDLIYNVSPAAPLGTHIGAPLLGVRGPYKRKAADDAE
jgi:hypothetical protein